MYKCKHCGEEFEDKGKELAHYREFPKGACAADLVEGPAKDDKIPKPEEKEPVDVYSENIEAQVASAGKKHAEELKKTHPQVKVIIPIDKLNKGDARAIACTQGYIWNVKRGVPVILPEPVVDLFEQGGYQPTRVR